MPWLELSLTIRAAEQPRVEAALEDLGALSITLRDADAETPDEEAIFEPGVGEVPLWNQIVLNALFDIEADRRGLTAAIADDLPFIEPAHIEWREVEDQDWERAWMDQFKPMPFGRRLWVYPWNIEPPEDGGIVVVRLDPGLAFGTGTHSTTALCLEWLDGQELAGRQVLDFGCGSGILAIAALLLGAERAVGTDIDPQALEASRDNASRNGIEPARFPVYLPADLPQRQADVLVANILAGPLVSLAPQLTGLVRPGGLLALSGILAEQAEEVRAAYSAHFDLDPTAEREGWIRISGRRRAD